MKKDLKMLYFVFAVIVFSISTIGATYAYWTASTESESEALQTESDIYSISMNINPLYHDFSVIPMNDVDAIKAIKNKCHDKYNRGACSAYTIEVYGYSPTLSYVSGLMDVTVSNMKNLSYMMLRLSDEYNDDSCAQIEIDGVIENYCIVKEATPIGEGKELSLGDSYDVSGMESTKFILVLWLSNLLESQNDFDIGSYTAAITMQAGNGGQIKGVISNAIYVEDTSGGVTEDTSGDVVEDTSGGVSDE